MKIQIRTTSLPLLNNFTVHVKGHYCQILSRKDIAIPTIVLLFEEKHVHFEEMIATFWDFFHIYVNERFVVGEIGGMLNGKTYFNDSFTLTRFR